MPGTPYRVPDEQPVGQWTVIVGAVRAHREERIASARQERVLGIDASDQHPAIRKITQ